MRGMTCVLVLSVLIAAPLAGQTTAGGSVGGVVRDEQGAVVPGVSIAAKSDSAPIVYRATSDRAGQYRFAELPPGEYTITADLTGFATVVRTPVIVRAGRGLSLDLEMKVGTVGETVEVKTESPLLDTRNGAPSVNVSGELLRSVPLSEGREWHSALRVAPGVISTEYAGSSLLYVRGSEPSATLVQLDGADITNSARSGVSYLNLSTDAIEDIQIQTGAVRASAPLGSGGVVNVVTASGTNRLKGAASLFFQPRKWNDSNQPGGTSTSINQVQVDLSLGGPIVKDHLWGFGSYRRSDITTGISRTGAQLAILETLVPGFRPIDATNEANFWFGKVTAQPGAHHISAFYQKDTNPVFNILSNAQHPFGQSTGGAAASLRVSSAWSNHLTTTLAASYNDKRRESVPSTVEGPNVRIYDRTIRSGSRLVGNGQLASLGNPVLSRLTQPNEKLAVSFDATFYVTHGSGSHEIQTGIHAERRVQGNHLTYVNDAFTMEEQVLRQPGVYDGGTVPFHRVVMGGPELTSFKLRTRDAALYIQDAWRPSSRLTATAGVRVDRIVTRDMVFGITSQESVDAGPRFGVNYAITADNRNVARGYWARVHDQPGLATTTGTPSVGQRDSYDLDLDGVFETILVTPPSSAVIANRRIDPDLHQPFVEEWGAGFSRQFAGSLTANVDITRRRFTDRPTLVEINGKYEGRMFAGYLDEAFNEIYMATNNRWNTPAYSSLEFSVTKRTPRIQTLASYVRQWRHIDGTWQPNDPASFIQPEAFPNDKGIGSSTGTASATSDANSLTGFHMTQVVTASAQWQDHVARAAATVVAPGALTFSANYTFQSGAWSGPVVTRVDQPDPAFGPPTVRLSNGRVVANPLATVIRFAYPTRGEGQLRTPNMHALNLRIGRRFTIRRAAFDASVDVFNATNNGADLGFDLGSNEMYSPLFGVMTDRQTPRSAQIALRVAF